ncbi:DUF4962 domain-containing protein [Pseudoduganella sp. GCM10020061]|uniref:DUF4962 domain-containing protein n=1 Tax=Pseudoduganella sp. GCM10020061 TaxID=3317345 RepID=UPI003627ABB4
MAVRKSTLVLSLAAALAGFSAPSHADWAQNVDPAVVKPMPNNLQVQPQNPPGFTWSRHPLNPPSYELEVSNGSTVVARFTTTRNFYLPSKAFPVGTYSWRVRPSNSTDWSTSRGFVINSTSKVFEVPENAAIRLAVSQHRRSSQLPKDFKTYAEWTPEMKAARGTVLTTLSNDVIAKFVTTPNVNDAMFAEFFTTTDPARKAAISLDIYRKIGAVTRQMESAALLYRITLDPRFLQEASRRGDQLAALDPKGATSFVNQDQATRQLALALVKTVDYLYNYIGAAQRTRWFTSVKIRATDMYNNLSANAGRMDQYPYDSHGGNNLGYLALTSMLLLGDIPEATTWFDFSYRAYVHQVYAWSGAEGGFSQGTAYGQYTADIAMHLWQPMSEATGVNMYSKPWAEGFAKFFMYFMPPGTVGHVFGDERETTPDTALLKAFTSRLDTPAAAWYTSNVKAAEYGLTLLQAKYPLKSATVAPAVPANAALFPSIGWVAMHSNLADVKRTSIFFKSSPYGSYNHSHSDQNTFVLNSKGRRLLIETGYQDYYMSPNVINWYRQTKAHNGITFDGGVGQYTYGNTQNLGYNGKITAFSTTPSLDYAEGDASAAYTTRLNSAVRKMWYLRNQDALLVQDKLVSPVARTFEWNMHGAAPIMKQADGSVSITNVDASVCLRSIGKNAASYQTRTGPAPKAGVVESHGAFVANSALTSAEFLVLVDVGCKKPAVTVTNTSNGRTVSIGGQSIFVPN